MSFYIALCAVNLDLVMPLEFTQVDTAIVKYFGWMKFIVLLGTVTYLSVVSVVGEMLTVQVLRMLMLSAIEQVCCRKVLIIMHLAQK